mmetsp:Transcript_8194/g.14593  ORF Transcript_8194/g.14593 Transcript_8194/m.14593 type:complete len:202 (+) Transcript_8194:441-1046(+)
MCKGQTRNQSRPVRMLQGRPAGKALLQKQLSKVLLPQTTFRLHLLDRPQLLKQLDRDLHQQRQSNPQLLVDKPQLPVHHRQPRLLYLVQRRRAECALALVAARKRRLLLQHPRRLQGQLLHQPQPRLRFPRGTPVTEKMGPQRNTKPEIECEVSAGLRLSWRDGETRETMYTCFIYQILLDIDMNVFSVPGHYNKVLTCCV